jgi:hypothetical protein
MKTAEVSTIWAKDTLQAFSCSENHPVTGCDFAYHQTNLLAGTQPSVTTTVPMSAFASVDA